MKKIIYITSMFLTAVLWYGCKEEGRIDHIDDSPAPAPVTVKGEPVSKPGGAVIRYVVPNDENLLGVRAVYVRNGETCFTEASLFTDSLTIEGFGDVNPHKVSIYSVGRNDKLSVPVEIDITPLTSPVATAAVTLDPTFGGVDVSFSNPYKASLAIVLMVDSLNNGIWMPLQTFYTAADAGHFYSRGLLPKEARFAAYLRDRWNNKGEMLTATLTPFEEAKLDRLKFRNAKLPGDFYANYLNSSVYTLEMLWNGGGYAANVNDYSGCYSGPGDTPFPFHFTIDLGETVSLSRFKVYPQASGLYSNSMVRFFEIWGSDDPPLDGSWDNWHLLGKYEIFKPSGYGEGKEVGPVTQDDINYITDGGDYNVMFSDEVPDPYIPIRYLRFKILNTFETYSTGAKSAFVVIAELEFWGRIIK